MLWSSSQPDGQSPRHRRATRNSAERATMGDSSSALFHLLTRRLACSSVKSRKDAIQHCATMEPAPDAGIRYRTPAMPSAPLHPFHVQRSSGVLIVGMGAAYRKNNLQPYIYAPKRHHSKQKPPLTGRVAWRETQAVLLLSSRFLSCGRSRPWRAYSPLSLPRGVSRFGPMRCLISPVRWLSATAAFGLICIVAELR